MRALVIEHDEFGPAEGVGEHLQSRGFALEIFRVLDDPQDPVSHKPFPDLGSFDLLVVTGAIWSLANTEPIASWIHREVALVQEAHSQGTPVLGMCFGAQVLSVALGGEVTKSPQPEIGWCPVTSDVAEVGSGPWFEWHYDQFSVPEGATELARNAVSSQMFRSGRSLGTQFHPEVTPLLLDEWINQGLDEMTTLGLDPDNLRTENQQRAQENRRQADRLVDWFLAEVAGL